MKKDKGTGELTLQQIDKKLKKARKKTTKLNAREEKAIRKIDAFRSETEAKFERKRNKNYEKIRRLETSRDLARENAEERAEENGDVLPPARSAPKKRAKRVRAAA